MTPAGWWSITPPTTWPRRREAATPISSGLTPRESAAYSEAYRAYCEGDFRTGLQHLRQVPLEDPIGSFLMREILNRQDDELPRNWDGVLEFRSK